jgi:hypothetical protein
MAGLDPDMPNGGAGGDTYLYRLDRLATPSNDGVAPDLTARRILHRALIMPPVLDAG